MAWRIDESVIRGELDNRIRGRVTGRIWFVGRDAPVEFDLAGNAWRDLAGRRLEFVNPDPKPGDLGRFAARQTGVIGDCTASRKVRVPEVSMDELMRRYERREPFPWHWGNSLYFEWFSAANGRVVIESASYALTISPDIAWDMTPEEEEAQRRANGEAMLGFMERLGGIVSGESDTDGDGAAGKSDAAWDEGKPQTEEEAEKMQADNDRLLDRIQARMEREGSDADYGKILGEELERLRRERGDTPLTPEEEARSRERMDELNRAAEEVVNNPDPEWPSDFEHKHPLAERAFELSVRLMREPEARGWLPEDAGEEHPLVELGACAAKAGAKFAGALGGESWPPPLDFCAGILVRLKRARGYLDDALRAEEACAEQALGEAVWLADVRRELAALAQGCDELIDELRARLERGSD